MLSRGTGWTLHHRGTIEGPGANEIEGQHLATCSDRMFIVLLFNYELLSVPIRQKTRAIWSTKLNSTRPEISLDPLAACSVLERS